MAYNFNDLKARGLEIQEWLKKEYQSIRTGRATPTVLDGVKVDVYGSKMPVNQIAHISVEDAQSLRVVPWDQSQVKIIEKAIHDSDLGLSVNIDDKGLRIIFPELTGERREQFKKIIGNKREDAVVSLRTARVETWDDIQKQKKDGSISEDDMYRAKENMESIIQDVQKILKEIEEKKIKEIEA